jgi:hypothetical protein
MIKRGEISPDVFDESDVATILSLLQANPLLIRRPLLEVDGVCRAGFDVAEIHAWIGLSAAVDSDESLEACRHDHAESGPCTGHEGVCCHEPNLALET